MTWTVFSAALASSFLHATWNMLAKTRAAPSELFVGIVLATASICAVLIVTIGMPSPTTWPWIGAASLCNAVYVRLAIRAYATADYAVAYGVARAMVPPTLFVIGWLALSETGRPSGVVGIALVAVSLLLFATRTLGTLAHKGFGLSIVAGLVLALSLLLDVVGIRLGGLGVVNLLKYTAASSLTTATILIVLSIARDVDPFTALRKSPLYCYLGAALLLMSYLFGMWAYAQGPIGMVAPLREGGILFSGVLAVCALRERVTHWQWFAMALATAGIVLIQVG